MQHTELLTEQNKRSVCQGCVKYIFLAIFLKRIKIWTIWQLISVQEQRQLQLLNNGLITADKFINKNYLINISDQQIVPLDEYEKSTNVIRLFQIIKLVYDKTENINDKLISVYSALQNVESSALLIINGTGKEATFYIGIRSVDNAATASKILEKSFIGNFPEVLLGA